MNQKDYHNRASIFQAMLVNRPSAHQGMVRPPAVKVQMIQKLIQGLTVLRQKDLLLSFLHVRKVVQNRRKLILRFQRILIRIVFYQQHHQVIWLPDRYFFTVFGFFKPPTIAHNVSLLQEPVFPGHQRTIENATAISFGK